MRADPHPYPCLPDRFGTCKKSLLRVSAAFIRHNVQSRILLFRLTGEALSLNIKNEETYRLAVELAELTGETMTRAIAVACRERLEREKRRRSSETRARELRTIADRCAKLMGQGPSAAEHGDTLYDERGLPG